MAGRGISVFGPAGAAALACAMAFNPPSPKTNPAAHLDPAGIAGGAAQIEADSAALNLEAGPGIPASLTPDAASVRMAEQRLRSALTPVMAANFRLFLYVDKSASGPLAQRMFVFEKTKKRDLRLLHVWPVSTGRESQERDPTGHRVYTETPAGYYELDPKRVYASYRSVHWNEPMPHAMFFNRVEHGYKTGLAIHGAPGAEMALLGRRASAGCVRLAPQNARRLFELVREKFAGPAPVLAFDARSRSSSISGAFARDTNGVVQMASGYQVLVLIEQNEDRKEVAALL
jgi:lipoprotein-anchoring transpeptidase ErfK/SrfK